ncbi:MAG: MerR family transcriptional regulator [Proteobacteria bacterium]|nr:MerR family transcriptional regulator [Pseudomonadota bacterium]
MSVKKEIDKKQSIGQVADELGVKTHVIRFWESKFPQIQPEIGKGGRRYYFNKDLEILKRIKSFLYEEGYTVSGLQKLLKQRKKESKAAKKDENLQLLLDGGDDRDYDIDDFLTADNSASDLSPKNQKEIADSISQIELNLGKFEQLLKSF